MNIEISHKKLTIRHPSELYEIMQSVLRREEKFDKHKEHFWVLALDYGNTILSLEHIATGTKTSMLVEPAEVLSIPITKGASRLMLVHNHPSGILEPSEGDKDITDRLIQACKLMKVPVLDHLIISEHSYYSFKDSGLLQRLENSNKYVLPYELEKKEYHDELELTIHTLQKELKKKLKETLEKGRKEVANKQKEQIVQQMLSDGESLEKIQKWTGLSPARIEALKGA